MSTKDNMLTDISAELDKEFGAPGTRNVKSSMKKHTLLYRANIIRGKTGSKSNSV